MIVHHLMLVTLTDLPNIVPAQPQVSESLSLLKKKQKNLPLVRQDYFLVEQKISAPWDKDVQQLK